MARLAASEYGADWVINTDADEFWWPRGGSLKDVLAALPETYGIVQAFWRSFVPRPDDGSYFAERMTVRLSQHAPINDPTSFYRPVVKVAHRADPQVNVGRGNHALAESSMRTLTTWHPIEVLHFPLRSRAQWMRKVELQGEAFTKHIERSGTGYHLKGYDALKSGRIEQQHDSLVVDDEAVARESSRAPSWSTPGFVMRCVVSLRTRLDGGTRCPKNALRRCPSRHRRFQTTPSTPSKRRRSPRLIQSARNVG